MKLYPADEIRFCTESFKFYSSLNEGGYLKKLIDKALDCLKENMLAGESIKKNRIPKYYLDKHGVNNLYRYRLDKVKRLCYTITADQGKRIVVILEIFLDHKSYERRFSY